MWEIKDVDGYSELIEPKNYHSIMRDHLYIKETDEKIYELINEKVLESSNKLNICEIGGGTGALTKLIASIENINLTVIEIDIKFYTLLKSKFKNYNNVKVIHSDIIEYIFEEPIDIFFSMGVHHHIPKGHTTRKYLSKVKLNLSYNGVYLLGDEFIPPYNNDRERTINLIIWFSHIIENARLQGFDMLAVEESRTLYYDILGIEDYKNSLDDLDKELIESTLARNNTIRFGPKDDIGGLYICQIG